MALQTKLANLRGSQMTAQKPDQNLANSVDLNSITAVLPSSLSNLHHLLDFPMGSFQDQIMALTSSVDIRAITELSYVQRTDMANLIADVIRPLNLPIFSDITKLITLQPENDKKIAEVISGYNPETFTTMLASLHLDVGINDSAAILLKNLTANQVLNLNSVIGSSEEINLVLDVLTDKSTTNELPESIRYNLDALREFAYDNAITVAIFLTTTVHAAWVVESLLIPDSKNFDVAASTATTLLTILILLKDMPNKG